jgi:hypothetical protein
MNTYEIELKHSDHKMQFVAETRSKAKYACFRYFRDDVEWDIDFVDFLKSIYTCRKIHSFHVSDLFGDREQFNRMAKMRGIDFAYQGMRIAVEGKMGSIVGSNSSLNLDVVFDGQYHESNCHPWWETVYFDRKRNVVADYRKVKNEVAAR